MSCNAVHRWRAALKGEMRDRLDFRPEDRIAERMATFDQMTKLVWRKPPWRNPRPAEWATALASLSGSRPFVSRSRTGRASLTGCASRRRTRGEPQVMAFAT